MNKQLRGAALALAIAFSATASFSQDRSLYWSALDVDARLEADGDLHVVEKQTMVFDGEWNGGERSFNLRDQQGVQLASLVEIDAATGAEIPFSRGDLQYTQTYDWSNASTLRWRAKASSDPPFENATKIYVLTYTMTNVLARREDRYRLSHDFAFAGRAGVIEKFTLDFELDPVWQSGDSFESHVELTDLQPGRSFVLNLPLSYSGTGKPRARNLTKAVDTPKVSQTVRRVSRGAPSPIRVGLGVVLILALLVMFGRFYLDERLSGRFAPLPDQSAVDRAWMEKEIFSRKAEIVGAAWDEKIGGEEVAALLARLAVEGKISSHVEEKKGLFVQRSVLHLKKLEEFEGLPSHEKKLLDLLFAGAKETSTDRIRKIYKDRGFNPVGVISPALENSFPWSKRPFPIDKRESRIIGVSILVYVVGIIIAAVLASYEDTVTLIGTGIMVLMILPVLFYLAHTSRRNLQWAHAGLLKFLVPFALIAWVILSGQFFVASSAHLVTLLLFAGLVIALFRLTLKLASTTGEEKRLDVRKKLLAGRRYFVNELKKEQPDLEDAWFPYILAFGLGDHADRWFKAFGGAAAAATTMSTRSFDSSSSLATAGSSGSSFSIGGRWSGGGSSFGGAGASGSWTVAAAGMASGVSSPSSGGSGSSGGSSSSSSSSSSSGGSSGGGGGGGW